MGKRLFDLCLVTMGLIVFSPLFLGISILVKLTSSGPIFYRAQRAGRYGNPFTMYKFRSMVVNADTIGGPSTSGDDPRLTNLGVFLRAHNLDELPQLLNVLKGDMSIVGPRPEILGEVALYTEEEKKLLTVRPGMTDWSSLREPSEGEILRGSKDPHRTYREKVRPEKIRLGLLYIQKRNFLVDVQIIMKTFLRIFR